MRLVKGDLFWNKIRGDAFQNEMNYLKSRAEKKTQNLRIISIALIFIHSAFACISLVARSSLYSQEDHSIYKQFNWKKVVLSKSRN